MSNRRQFLKGLARGGIFASLTMLTGVLIHRWSEADECGQSYSCRNCGLSNSCGLPEADKFRLEKAKRPESR